MPYLIKSDLKPTIQLANLDQVMGSDDSIIFTWLQRAQEKAISYLIQKWDTSVEFTNTNKWNQALVYKAGDRIYLDAPIYAPTTSYIIGQYTVYQNNFYIATASTTGSFDPTKWTLINPQYTIYYGTYPAPPFNINTKYNIGDKVYYLGKVYTALQPSALYDQTYLLQIGLPYPPINYFPGTPGYAQWDAGTAYSISANTPITDTKWTQGDNRSQEMVNIICDIVLYYAHRRISPMNIPEVRLTAYKEAINWLKDASDGLVTPNLPRKQPNQGNKIRFGTVRGGNINSY